MRIPLLILAALLATSLIVALGGVRLSRREVQERVPAARSAIREFAEQWQNETSRLKDVYEDDLEQLASTTRTDRPWSLIQACRGLYGVSAAAVVKTREPSEPKRLERLFLDPVDPATTERLPEVWLAEGQSPESELKKQDAFLLRTDEIAATISDRNGTPHGWLSAPRRDFGLFWFRRRDRTTIVLMVDWRELHRRTSEYMARWALAPFTEVHAADDQALVQSPEEITLMGTASRPVRPPDLIIPMQGRMGAWQIVSWDRVTTRVTHSTSGLAASMALSAALAVLGGLIFRQQIVSQRLAEQRVSFVNRVSHELGTPLTNLLLNLDLATEAISSNPDQARQRLGYVTEEVHRLARLVSNVLTFSRKERGTLELAAACCVPDAVVGDVLRQFKPALDRRGIAVEFREAAVDGVLLDRDALAQIVGNLLSNVEKYAGEGKRLEIETRSAGESLTVIVRDFGPGIPPGERERIFKPFERLSNRVNEGASGTGLGLAIARELAQRMGGRIEMADCHGPGAQFELSLPAPRVLTSLPHQATSSQSAA